MRRNGFTVVELLIVIVVIAILAAITTVAYTGIQQRARDSQRRHDMTTIAKALELYYTDNGRYPSSAGGSTTINGGWSTTADASWQFLVNQLVPQYVSALPRDPLNVQAVAPWSGGGYSYAYYSDSNTAPTAYCGAPDRTMYILIYHNEAAGVQNAFNGDCSSNPLGPYGGGSSNIRMSKK